jgi:hypothetical protein
MIETKQAILFSVEPIISTPFFYSLVSLFRLAAKAALRVIMVKGPGAFVNLRVRGHTNISLISPAPSASVIFQRITRMGAETIK